MILIKLINFKHIKIVVQDYFDGGLPPRQASNMAHLHWKRLNFIQKGQNASRYPQVDIKTGIFA